MTFVFITVMRKIQNVSRAINNSEHNLFSKFIKKYFKDRFFMKLNFP